MHQTDPVWIQRLPERVASKITVNPETGCWLWTGYVHKRHGYARGTVARVTCDMHRFVYEHLVGPVPTGLQLDHLCRIRHCVNPIHLRTITCRENLLAGEGPTGQRARQTTCIYGHPFDDANTYYKRNGQGRFCRACAARRSRERRRRVT